MIEFQIGGRKTGKTTLLLEWLVDQKPGERRVIVFASFAERDLAYRRALEQNLNVDPNQFVPLVDVRSGALRGIQNLKIGVDNLDLMLHALFGGDVCRVTATGVDILHLAGSDRSLSL